jgi:hypothetical protein
MVFAQDEGMETIRRTALGFAALVAAGVGCQVLGGIEPDLRLEIAGELCGNGSDDDGDGLADCEDVDCGAISCSEGAPPGWAGPFWVTSAAWEDPKPPPCPGGLEQTTHYAGPAGPPKCEPCECAPVEGAVCSAPNLKCGDGFTLCGGDMSFTFPAPASCSKPGGLPQAGFGPGCTVQGASEVVEAGGCAITEGAELDGPLTWQTRVVVCGPIESVGCEAGAVCRPEPTAGARYCVRGEGSASCPTGWEAAVVDAFTGGTDTRACTTCTCGAPSVTCEGYAFTFYDNTTCDPAQGQAPIDIVTGACKSVKSLVDDGEWGLSYKPAVPVGQCAALGGEPMGEMIPEGPVKYCCK